MRIRGRCCCYCCAAGFRCKEEFSAAQGIYPRPAASGQAGGGADGLKLMQSLVMTENFQGLGFSSLDR